MDLKNPDFCRLVEAYGVPVERVRDLQGLKEKLQSWLELPGPGLLEWQTKLLAPWEAGAIQRPAIPPPGNRPNYRGNHEYSADTSSFSALCAPAVSVEDCNRMRR